jgi:hypothetical protein
MEPTQIRSMVTKVRWSATLYIDGGMTLFPEFRFGG